MRVPRWTTSLVCAGLLGAVLSGCRSREHAFRATRVPVVRFDSVLKTADSVRLPLADAIYSAHLKVDLPLTPGQTRREPARIVRVNPFRVAHQRLRDTPLEKMKLVWQTSDIVFADGNRLSLSAP